ncbi:hypothetical protein K474DRAFT_1669074 [Panus rudis PR-1116 ss-1]|nr:hypothetical protein K474DRAFT_1669074 [Panus rudis PR-1116 ss-1]
MDKPLPDVPATSRHAPAKLRISSSVNLTTLSVEGRSHLRRFLLQALEEERAQLPEYEKWVDPIESGLRALGESIALGGWLAGFRRALAMKKMKEREKYKRAASAESVSRGKDDKTAEKGRHRRNSEEQDRPALQGKRTTGQLLLAPPPGPEEEIRQAAFQNLKSLAARPVIPVPKPSAKHLVLTVSPFGTYDPSLESDYEVVQANYRCTFSPGVYSFPTSYPELQAHDASILYGLEEWFASPVITGNIQIVGGSFTIFGTSNIAQHVILTKILKLSSFLYLSLILEQHVLSDSHVVLQFPKPSKSPTIPSASAGNVHRTLSSGGISNRSKRDSGSGLWAYLSKKKDNLLSRATGVVHSPPLLTRSGSLDLPLSYRPGSQSLQPRVSTEESGRSRRLSFIGDLRPSFLQSKEREQPPSETLTPSQSTSFGPIVSLLRRYEDLLSTSPGVRVSPPKILLDLADKEEHDPKRKLTGDEKAALTSILGWMGKHDSGHSLVGTSGFVRQQSFSVLYSEHVPSLPVPGSSRPSTPSSQRNASSSSLSAINIPPPLPRIAHCGKRRTWVTYRFYADNDERLGEAVIRLCSTVDDPCQEIACPFKRGEHELRWIHGGVRILGNVSHTPETDPHRPSVRTSEEELPEMWESCKVCQKKSETQKMSDGTYLMSFAKYLELLIYSPKIFHLGNPICEHTSFPPRPREAADTPYPRTRFNIVRNFSYRGKQLSLTIFPVEDVYEVRVPRLQLVRGRASDKNEDAQISAVPERFVTPDDDRRQLRREIMRFWQGLSEHIDELEENFITDHSIQYHKSLPRLPSADDAYDSFDEDDAVTPKGPTLGLPAHLPNTPQTPDAASTPKSHASGASFPFPRSPSFRAVIASSQHDKESTATTDATITVASSGSGPSSDSSMSTNDMDSLQRLSNLRHTFQRTEQDLYAELSRTPEACLNDVRRSFQSAARGATKRLSAWEAKHAGKSPSEPCIPEDAEPDWWKAGCHAVPGGNVIVREDDWGSIIAFTLSSLDYHRELSNMTVPRSNHPPLAPPPTPSSPRPSFLSKAAGKLFTSSAPEPDPDQEGVVWNEPEPYSAVISRKEHPRDPTSLLTMTIPEVLRQKAHPEGSTTTTSMSKFVSLGVSSGKAAAGNLPLPPSAWAKPEVQLSMDAAGGSISNASAEAVDKILHGLDVSPEHIRTRKYSGTESQGSSGFVETNIRRGKAASLMSTDSDHSTIGPESNSSNLLSPPPPPPPKDTVTPTQSKFTQASSSSTPPKGTKPEQPQSPSSEDPNASTKSSSISSSLTNTLSAALRYVTKSGDPPPTPAKHHHGLLSATGSPTIDDRPHIKYDWTIGKRLRFSCTVYYAKQFDALRRRCGIEDVFLRSLARCENWQAEGGKSRSNFWKTSDDQFIIKTLVNAWNVADLQALIELSPMYFRYMDATANRPTVLVKMLGFYTIEIRNLETGTTQAKADLLVMENLFYKQKIAKTFDLKGIQGRRVKASANSHQTSKILFDGDWIEGQQKALTLIYPHSKVVLDEAIRADCDFLAKSNIMDYSLLLGICDDRKTLTCGLVDTIGSYTFAKTLEYKAKQGLNAGKEVTVVPPAEYQDRFIHAMDTYFMACPDKWSRPMDDTRVPSDHRQLPSVL